MSALKWFLVATAVIGIALFLFGANYSPDLYSPYYDPVVGWIGVSLGVSALVGLLMLYIYDAVTKWRKTQKS